MISSKTSANAISSRFSEFDKDGLCCKKGIKYTQCYVGLGSNLTNALGSPHTHIKQAVQGLRAHRCITEVRASSLYQSAPMGPQDQEDFINAVVALKTTLTAAQLLAVCQQLESNAMRVRKRHWGERSLDVDILLYGQAQLHTPTLIIPHQGLFERNFVLIPLLELAPDMVVLGQRIKELPAAQDWSGLRKVSA